MASETGDQDSYDLGELLNRSDLAPEARRAVYDAVVNSVIEGAIPDRESVRRLVEFAAGRIDFEEYRQRVVSAHTWRRQEDVADLFSGPADASWDTDRELINDELRQADADYSAGKTITGEELRQRFRLP